LPGFAHPIEPTIVIASLHLADAGPTGNGRQRNLRRVNEAKKAFILNVIASFQVPVPRSGGRSTLDGNGLHRYGPPQ
jgi:hypothetical protein